MRAFFDTTVLVAAVLEDHLHHEPSMQLFSRASSSSSFCAVHNLAEVYSTLTRYPGIRRLTPDQALLALEEIESRISFISLDAREYKACIRKMAGHGIGGGGVYDGLIAACALKVKAEVLYTWNLRHFLRLGADVQRIVRTP